MTDGEIGIIVCARNRLVLWHGPRAEGLLRLSHFSAMEALHPTRADYRLLTVMPTSMPFWARQSLDRALAVRDYDAIITALAVPIGQRASLPMPAPPEEDDASSSPPLPRPVGGCP
jgi:hypothetical protein